MDKFAISVSRVSVLTRDKNAPKSLAATLCRAYNASKCHSLAGEVKDKLEETKA